MKRILIAMLVLLCSISLFAAPTVNSRIIDPQSEIYDYMDALYALNNKAKPETNRPWTEAQARLLLNSVDRSKQSGVALDLYNEILEIINEGQRWNIDENFGFSVVPEINAEGYLHTNTEDFTTETQFVRSFADRKPWLKIGMDFTLGDFFYTTSDLMWRNARGSHKNVWADYDQTYVASYKLSDDATYPISDYYFKRAIGTNVNFDTYDFDFIFPHRAIVSVGGKNWNVSVNRDRMKIGDAHFGNLLVDDNSDYNDYINFSFFSNKFSYNWILMPLNTNTEFCEVMTNEARLYLIHMLDFRIWDRVDIKLSENVMYKYQTFDLGFLNPAFIYHNLNNRGMFNAIAYLEINASIIPGLDVYGQYTLDQARAPNEGDSQADASGIVLGVEYTAPAMGGVVESYVEIASTTPLLYRRDKVDFIKVSNYYHQGCSNEDDNYYGHYPEFEYIGFPFGGDTRLITTGATYTLPGYLKAEASITAMEKGSMTILTSHNVDGDNDDDANKKGKTPTVDEDGNITRALVLSTSAEFSLDKFFKYPDVSLLAEVDYVATSKFNKETKVYSDKANDLQVTLGISCKF